MMKSGIHRHLYCLSVLFLLIKACGVGLCQEGQGDAGAVPVWRFWSPSSESHFYTASESEKDKLVSDYNDVWIYEKVAFRAFVEPSEPNLSPVYRLWSDSSGCHWYTLDVDEKDAMVAADDGWVSEGVAFYVYRPGAEPVGATPVQCYWFEDGQDSLYTVSQREGFIVAGVYPDLWEHRGIAWYADSSHDAGAVTIIKGPYLQDVTQDSATVMWETDVPADSMVEYDMGRAGSGMDFNSVPVMIHKMCISELEPDTAGVYRVTSGDAASDFSNFATAPAVDRSFRFAVYGDTRVFSSVHAEVIQGIIDSNPEIVFHVGDLVHTGRDYYGWGPEFFDPVGPLMRNTPVIPILGNHEYYTDGPVWFFYFFDRPLDEGWFAMTYGNMRVVGLNTNVAFGPGSPQYDWLLAELSSSEYLDATWHVVLLHHPAFTATTKYSDNPGVVSELVPLLEPNHVDIVFQGHSHTYERYFYNGVYYIVTGGGSGPLYDLTEDIEPPIRQFGLTINHHCIIDVNAVDKTLTLQAVDIDGQTFDTVELRKSN